MKTQMSWFSFALWAFLIAVSSSTLERWMPVWSTYVVQIALTALLIFWFNRSRKENSV